MHREFSHSNVSVNMCKHVQHNISAVDVWILVNDFCNFDPSPSIKIIKRRRTREPVDVAFGHFGQHGRRPDEHLGARGNRARHLCRFRWHLDTGLQRCAKWTAKPGSIASHVSHGVAYEKSHCHHLVIICRLLVCEHSWHRWRLFLWLAKFSAFC